MALIDLASNRSFWRGYDYHKNNKVKSFEIIDEETIKGVVRGSQIEDYKVEIHLNKPLTSTCTCPFSQEHSRSVCKHMVALYFAVYSEEAERIIQEIQDEEEFERNALMESIVDYVNSLSEQQVRKMLIDKMFDEDYERYVDDYYDRHSW